MRILGIIAEYDPFHRGHERHLRLAREAVQPDFVYVALSGCIRQRGEPALLSPYDRACCALDAGADAVFAMPAEWTVRDAEHYALGGVALLKRLGATHLAFGAETPDPGKLREIAEKLENPPAALRGVLKESLQAGHGYPRALGLALERENGELAEIIRRPNNILAVCYLRAMLRTGGEIQPVIIPRNGDYHEEGIDPESPSASALREALRLGNYGPAFGAVTPASREAIREAFLGGRVPRKEIWDAMLISRLREMSREEIRALPDISEGLEDRLKEAAGRIRSREELLEAVSTRRYPKARISRICAAAMLGLTRRELNEAPLPERAVLLGLRKNRDMTAMWRSQPEMITTEWENGADLRAWKVWAQCAGLPDSLPRTSRVASL